MTALRAMADDSPDVPADQTQGSGDLAKVHAEMLKRYSAATAIEIDNVTNGREDQRFYAGDQWDAESRKARGTTRPMLTINRLPAFVRQLTGDVRQNPPAIKVLPAKGEASQETADILNGVIRDIEAESDGVACYVIAVDNAAQTGQGAFRIVAEYEDDNSFDQELRIRPIRDPFGFLIDPMAQLPDKSDMGFAWVFERMSVEAFKAKYPDKTIDDMPMGQASENGMMTFAWRTGDTVRIAEYWRKEETGRKKYRLEDGSVVDELPKKVVPRDVRAVKETKVVMYMVSGREVLSGPHPWAGKNIPICVVTGEESVIDGAVNRRGIIRDAKDAQRLYNYSRTAAAEAMSHQPKMPWLLSANMIAGYEDDWDRAGTENLPYLIYKPDELLPNKTPERAQPALAQDGLDSQAMLSAQDIEAVTGIFKANLGQESNEKSGRAIMARQKEGDTGTFLYVDNLRRAISYCGRCLVDLIPKIYDGERIVRMLKEDGDHEMVPVNKPVPVQGIPGQFAVQNDLSIGKYSVQVSTGPSYLTRRQEQAAVLVELASKLPIVGQVAPDLLVKAIDFPGGDELAARLAKTVPDHLKAPEGAPPPPPPPPPPDVIAKAEKDAATAEKTRAETEGQEIKNITDFVALQSMMVQIGASLQIIQGGIQQMMATQGGQPPPGPPPMMPPPGMSPGGPMPPPGPPPMPQPDAGPPIDLAELEPITNAGGPQ